MSNSSTKCFLYDFLFHLATIWLGFQFNACSTSSWLPGSESGSGRVVNGQSLTDSVWLSARRSTVKCLNKWIYIRIHIHTYVYGCMLMACLTVPHFEGFLPSCGSISISTSTYIAHSQWVMRMPPMALFSVGFIFCHCLHHTHNGVRYFLIIPTWRKRSVLIIEYRLALISGYDYALKLHSHIWVRYEKKTLHYLPKLKILYIFFYYIFISFPNC